MHTLCALKFVSTILPTIYVTVLFPFIEDETSRQITAFTGLVQAMNTAKQCNLHYFYQEYKVHIDVLLCMYVLVSF